jgi:hypothetical protein
VAGLSVSSFASIIPVITFYCTITASIMVTIPFTEVMTMTEFTITEIIIAILIISAIIIDAIVIVVRYTKIVGITIA